jgi:hypothetical protein
MLTMMRTTQTSPEIDRNQMNPVCRYAAKQWCYQGSDQSATDKSIAPDLKRPFAGHDFKKQPEVAHQAEQRVFKSRRTVLFEKKVAGPGKSVANERQRNPKPQVE